MGVKKETKDRGGGGELYSSELEQGRILGVGSVGGFGTPFWDGSPPIRFRDPQGSTSPRQSHVIASCECRDRTCLRASIKVASTFLAYQAASNSGLPSRGSL